MQGIKGYIILAVVTVILFGCQSFHSFSPEEMIEKALAATEEPKTSYYGEMVIKENGAVDELMLEDTTIKEWHDGNRSRSEIISPEGEMIIVQNGAHMQMYIVDEKIVHETEDGGAEEFSYNPKEQLNNLLTVLGETHDIETVGEETVADRQTHHLKATARDDGKSIFGDLELWIDEEYWIPLRTQTRNGEIEIEIEYVQIDYDARFTESLFELEIPEGVSVETLEGLPESEELKKADIIDVFEEPIYIIEESNEWEIESIHLTDEDEEFQFKWLEIDYLYNGLPSLSLTISSNENFDEDFNEEMLESLGDLAETVPVRDTEALLIDSTELFMLSWFENDLEYSVNILDQSIEMDELLQIIETMTKIK